MNPLLIATTNPHKIREIRQLLTVKNLQLVFPSQQITVKETGATFKQNAVIKAKAYAQSTGLTALADDSGLCINALNGFPGIQSSRFAAGNHHQAVKAILKKLAHARSRSARFKICLALYNPQTKNLKTFSAVCHGRIAHQPAGAHGFGYDPIFIPRGYQLTFSQLPDPVKNQISHRALAFKQLNHYLNQ